MKKQLLLIAALLVGSQVLAKPVQDRMIEFHNLKDTQKIEWMDFMKDTMNQKINTMKQIHTDWKDFHNMWIKKIMAMTDCSENAKESLFNEKLNAAIDLYKKHMTLWKEFAKSHREKAEALCKKHQEAFDKFEGKETKELKKELTAKQRELETIQEETEPTSPAAAHQPLR